MHAPSLLSHGKNFRVDCLVFRISEREKESFPVPVPGAYVKRISLPIHRHGRASRERKNIEARKSVTLSATSPSRVNPLTRFVRKAKNVGSRSTAKECKYLFCNKRTVRIYTCCVIRAYHDCKFSSEYNPDVRNFIVKFAYIGIFAEFQIISSVLNLSSIAKRIYLMLQSHF